MSQTSNGNWNTDRQSPLKAQAAPQDQWSQNSDNKDEATNSSSFKRNQSYPPPQDSNRGERPPVQCYNCQEMGHISRSCPNPRKEREGGPRPPKTCFKCGKPGHMSFECQGTEDVGRRDTRRRSRSRDRGDSY